MLQPSNPVRAKHPKPVHTQQGVMHGTAATRQIHALGLSGTTAAPRKRRSSAGKKKAASASGTRRRKASKAPARAARSGSAHLVKGSAAAKARMAKLRAMVGKKKAA